MDMPVNRYRSGLVRTLEKLRQGQLKVGFLGGSITDSRPGWNWPEPVVNWFQQNFPRVRLTVENLGIGATGSELACFNAQTNIIDRDCDLVFVEYAVNDDTESTEKRNRTREGLIRKLLAGRGRDVVLTYTFGQSFFADMNAGKMPASILELEQLADHYSIGSVWMSLHALNEVRTGAMRWEEWLPDGLHPQYRGSLSYAQAVMAYLQRELIDSPSGKPLPVGTALPAPRNPKHWELAAAVPFSQVELEGPWSVRRWFNVPGMDHILYSSALGAKMAFDFAGRAVTLGFDFGKAHADFMYRMDGGPWQRMAMSRPDWVNDMGWPRMVLLADDLPAGPHRLEIEVIHGDREGCRGTHFRLLVIGVVP